MTNPVRRSAAGMALLAVVAAVAVIAAGGPAYGGQSARARLTDVNGTTWVTFA